MAVSFRNSPLQVFIVGIGGLLVTSLAFGMFNGFYFSTKKEGEPLQDVAYGEKIKIKDLFKEQKVNYPWLNNGNFTFEAHVEQPNNKEIVVDEIVVYDKGTNTLTFNGVGKGSLWFISTFDASITFHADFNSSFKNKDLLKIIGSQYPALYEDSCLTKSEIKTIKNITLTNLDTFDGSDFAYFPALQSITIEGDKVTSITNNTSTADTKIYVQQDLYSEYLTLECFANYQNYLFPTKNRIDSYMVVLEKNGGTLFGSWDKSYACFEVLKGQAFADIPTDEEITKLGSNFEGWFDEKGNQYTKDTVITKDTKLYARWSLIEYYVTYHVKDPTTGEYSTDKEIHYYGEDLDIKDVSGSYTYDDRIFIGWAPYRDAVKAEYAPDYKVKGYFDGVNPDLDLYAVFAWKSLDFKIYNGENLINSITCQYGNSVILKYEGSEPVGAGAFAGYSLDPRALSKEYDNNELIHVKYDYENPDNMNSLYRTTEQENVLKFYCVFDPSTQFKITYQYTNANGVEEIATQEYCTYDDESSGTLVPNRTFTFRDFNSFHQNSTETLDRVGQNFIGWQRYYDGHYVLYSDHVISDYKGEVVVTNNFELEGGFDKCENVVLTPYYQYNTILVLMLDGSLANSEIVRIKYGDQLQITKTFYKTGYTPSRLEVSANDVILQNRANTTSISANDMKQLYEGARKVYGYQTHHAARSISIQISPVYTADPCNVYFDSDGGTSVATQYLHYGDKVTKPSNPKKDKNKFVYWYDSKTGNEWNFNTTLTGDLKLVAKWNPDGCVAKGTLVTMGDGSKKAIENIVLGDEVVTWNFLTGSFESQPVAYIQTYEATLEAWRMKFANGEEIVSIEEHSFFDYTRKEFITINKDHNSEFLNDEFFFETGPSKLISIEEFIYNGECYTIMPIITGNSFVNGLMNTIPEYVAFSKISQIEDDMSFNEEILNNNIALYGLADYADYKEYLSEELFNAYGGQYLNILFGLGLMNNDTLEFLQTFYDEFEGGL